MMEENKKRTRTERMDLKEVNDSSSSSMSDENVGGKCNGTLKSFKKQNCSRSPKLRIKNTTVTMEDEVIHSDTSISSSDIDNVARLDSNSNNASKSLSMARVSKRNVEKVKKNRRGRKPTISSDEIKIKLKGLPLFDETGMLLKETNKVWTDACLKLGGKLLKHTLYLKVYNNDDNIQTDLYGNEDGDTTKSVQGNSESMSESVVRMETTDALESVLCDVFFTPMLKELCIKPLHVIYWWPEHKNLYQEFYKKIDFPVIISSSIQVHPQISSNQETNIITAFAIHSEIEDEPVSFCQSLMTRTDTDHLHYFFCEWLREKIPGPTHILCTFSALEGAMLAFNYTTVEKYSLKCFLSLMDSKNSPPNFMLQVDCISFIVGVKNIIDECFTGDQFEEVKKFHLESVIYLASLIDLYTFEKTIKKICSILRSEYINQNIRKFITNLRENCSTQEIQGLKSKCEGVCSQKIDYDKLSEVFQSNEKDDLTAYLFDRYAEAKRDCSSVGNEINAYRNIKYLNEFLNLLKYFPLWTSICVPRNTQTLFEYNDLVDKYWGTLNRSLKFNETGMPSAENYVLKHGHFLLSEIQKFRGLLTTKRKNIRQDKDVEEKTNYHCFLQSQENWMGKVEADATKLFQNESLMDQDDMIETEAEKTLTGIFSSKTISDLSDIPIESKHTECSRTYELQENYKVESDIVDGSDLSRIENDHDYSKKKNTTDDSSSDIHKTDEQIMHSTPKNQPEKVGKYTTALPTIKAYHNRPSQKNVVKKLLKNKKPNKYQGKQYFYGNSSIFDSIAEVIIQAQCNFHQFKDFCVEATRNSEELDFLKSALMCADTGKIESFYKDKLILSMDIGSLNGDVIHFDEKLSINFAKLMKNHPSVIKKSICNCSFSETSYNFIVHEVPAPNTIGNCSKCGDILIPSVEVGSYIAFNYEEKLESFDIYKICDRVVINDKIYLLAGVIGYTQSKAKESFSHYTAYCRPVVGAWKIKDNFNKKAEYLKKKDSIVRIALILYVQQDL